ncbi:MAG: hypothetical protein GEU83_13450 [Pseudonocardiaceae bacterium]|nr:hypothetical protein [Pseudonocardiaceae bacterium]
MWRSAQAYLVTDCSEWAATGPRRRRRTGPPHSGSGQAPPPRPGPVPPPAHTGPAGASPRIPIHGGARWRQPQPVPSPSPCPTQAAVRGRRGCARIPAAGARIPPLVSAHPSSPRKVPASCWVTGTARSCPTNRSGRTAASRSSSTTSSGAYDGLRPHRRAADGFAVTAPATRWALSHTDVRAHAIDETSATTPGGDGGPLRGLAQHAASGRLVASPDRAGTGTGRQATI